MLCQPVAQHCDLAGLVAGTSHARGLTVQMDWAGAKTWLLDPIGGQEVSVFVVSMPFSGMVFACAGEGQSVWLSTRVLAFGHRLKATLMPHAAQYKFHRKGYLPNVARSYTERSTRSNAF